MKTYTYEGWISVFESGTDYEADLVRDRLDDAGLPAVVLTKRDHAWNLTIGETAIVYVMVPPDRAEEAQQVLASVPLSDEALAAAALAADPDAPPAHDTDEQAMLDSGVDAIRFTAPAKKDTGTP